MSRPQEPVRWTNRPMGERRVYPPHGEADRRPRGVAGADTTGPGPGVAAQATARPDMTGPGPRVPLPDIASSRHDGAWPRHGGAKLRPARTRRGLAPASRSRT